MPTGYTAEILDGKITTFPQFAKQCMRAFGATIHMRDDDMDAEFTPRTPSDYYAKEIKKANQVIKEAELLTDEEIIDARKKELQESKASYTKGIQECNNGRIAKTKVAIAATCSAFRILLAIKIPPINVITCLAKPSHFSILK